MDPHLENLLQKLARVRDGWNARAKAETAQVAEETRPQPEFQLTGRMRAGARRHALTNPDPQ
jgi:hypothetical protein